MNNRQLQLPATRETLSGFGPVPVMSYINIMVHVVWATKNREPLLTDDKRDILFSHIRQNARAKDIYIDTIGGYTDHVHCLISLGAEQSIAKVVQLIKGESSFGPIKRS